MVGRQVSPRLPLLTWCALLLLGVAAIYLFNPGGHMSTDTVISLLEARRGVRIAWGPPMFSSILGLFDKVSPGVALYVVSMSALLAASWAAMATLRPKVSWIAVVLLAFVISTPQVVLYQAIAWKDVAFANFSIAGFISTGVALRSWNRLAIRLPMLAVACVFLALGSLVRQNGALTILFFAGALGWAGWAKGWKRGVTWALIGLVAPLAVAVVLDAATPVKNPPRRNMDLGPRLVQGYDIMGAVARDPKRPLPAIEAEAPKTAALLRTDAPKVYSPERVDFLDQDKALDDAIGDLSSETLAEEWFGIIKSDPMGYLGQRLQVFRWVFATPIIDRCLPGYIGVDGPPKIMAALHIPAVRDRADERMWNYLTWWMDTAAYKHYTFAIVAAVVALFLAVRRQGADIAIAGLMLSALAFAASFFVISLACDYRYLYFLDLAAMTGALYVALDPSLKRQKR